MHENKKQYSGSMNVNLITTVKPNFLNKIVTTKWVILRDGRKVVYNFDTNKVDHQQIQSQQSQRVFPIR